MKEIIIQMIQKMSWLKILLKMQDSPFHHKTSLQKIQDLIQMKKTLFSHCYCPHRGKRTPSHKIPLDALFPMQFPYGQSDRNRPHSICACAHPYSTYEYVQHFFRHCQLVLISLNKNVIHRWNFQKETIPTMYDIFLFDDMRTS